LRSGGTWDLKIQTTGRKRRNRDKWGILIYSELWKSRKAIDFNIWELRKVGNKQP
jgi:hypothetical protein